MSVLIKCTGKYALFTRPEMKAERVSYDVMTPSAARGILDAIYWHPGVTWIVEEIYVRSPIKFISIRRNETKALLNTSAVISSLRNETVPPTCDVNENRTQRAALVLKNPEYYIKAHIELSPTCNCTADKVDSIVMNRLHRGACYHQPNFGCSEFPAYFEMVDEVPPCPTELKGDIDLNWMFWDWDYTVKPEKALFFRPVMHDGFIEVPKRGDLP